MEEEEEEEEVEQRREEDGEGKEEHGEQITELFIIHTKKLGVKDPVLFAEACPVTKSEV